MYRALLLQKLDDAGPIKKALVFVRLGDIHDKLGEKPKAVQMYERALQTDATIEEARRPSSAALKGLDPRDVRVLRARAPHALDPAVRPAPQPRAQSGHLRR